MTGHISLSLHSPAVFHPGKKTKLVSNLSRLFNVGFFEKGKEKKRDTRIKMKHRLSLDFKSEFKIVPAFDLS